MRRLFMIGCLAGLAGCASQAPVPDPVAVTTGPQSIAANGLRPYPETTGFLQCVPFARAVSGVDIYGDAWTWWDKAAGKYQRGNKPSVAAVLVLKPTKQMKLGHVAVVAQLQDSRHLLVTHANWGNDGNTRGVVHERMPIMDVSAANDWSEIKLMNSKGSFGGPYAAWGFIYPNRAPERTAEVRQ